MDPHPVIVSIRDNRDYLRVLLIPLLQGGGSSLELLYLGFIYLIRALGFKGAPVLHNFEYFDRGGYKDYIGFLGIDRAA